MEKSSDNRVSEESEVARQGWPFGVSSIERRLGNGMTRVVVAVIAIPLLLLVLAEGGAWLSLFATLLSIGVIVELASMLERVDMPMYFPWVVVSTLLVHSLVGVGTLHLIDYGTATGLVFSFLILAQVVLMVISLSDENRKALGRILGSNFAFSYGGLLPATLPILYGVVPHYLARKIEPAPDGTFPPLDSSGGFELTLLMFVAIWLTDTGAYLVGRSLGKRKLAPTISPNKSVEGAVGGLLFAVVASLLLGDLILPSLDLLDLLAIGLIAGVVGQLGDLAESHLKRASGVKDSSAIIPGHGGILDRFDSLLLVAPTLLIYLSLRVTLERLLS